MHIQSAYLTVALLDVPDASFMQIYERRLLSTYKGTIHKVQQL